MGLGDVGLFSNCDWNVLPFATLQIKVGHGKVLDLKEM